MLAPLQSQKIPMPKLSHHLAFVALALWLLGNWAGAHGHYCFDGQEPQVSVHMDVMGGHLDHHEDEVHQDADVNWLQSVIAKLSKIDVGLMLFATLALLLAIRPATPLIDFYRTFLKTSLPHSRPPLRAPPLPV